MSPAEIAAALGEIAIYLELEGERFRAQAHLRAARSLEASHDLERLIREGRLAELPGVGASIAGLGRADVLNTLPPDDFARAVAPRGSS